MKTVALMLALAAPLTLGLAAPALAEAEAAAPRLSVDTPLETILADPAGKAVLLANMPGIDTHPMLDMVKTMSLRQIQPYSEGKITDELLAKIAKELGEIK
jgi:hypothetical protein